MEKRLVKTGMGCLEEYTASCVVLESIRLARLYNIAIEPATEIMIGLLFEKFNDDCRYIHTNEGWCLELTNREIDSIVDYLEDNNVTLADVRERMR